MTDPNPLPADRTPASRAPLVGRVLDDRYRIESLIARGGMGSVFRAEQLPEGTYCALKVVTTDDVDAEAGQFVERFIHEAKLTSGLAHPNCVSVIDFGQTSDGIFYLAMELLEGNTLAHALRASGPFPPARFLHVARQVCAGVRAAHALGIVHRDLKTANLFLVPSANGEDVVKVLDFGIAKRPQDAALALTRPGQMLGTPTYMAPEQILERPIDTRADIYSLGIIFFELLVGRPPFDGTDFLTLLAAHAREPVPLMAAVCPDIVVPVDLEAIVRRMLEKEPAQRFADLGEVLEALSVVDPSSPLHAHVLRSSVPSMPDDEARRSAGDATSREAKTRISRAPPGSSSGLSDSLGTSPGGALDSKPAEASRPLGSEVTEGRLLAARERRALVIRIAWGVLFVALAIGLYVLVRE